MFRYKNKAFTLVELVVVITILAILGTIAFISLEGYSKDARDSTRISDLSAMKTSLELFHLNAGKYPETTGGFSVTYSGSDVWTQGTFGSSTKNNVDALDKIPTDSLTGKEYTYSVTKTKQEYELSGIIESDEYASSILTNQANAGDVLAIAIVTGNYNGKILKTLTGSDCEILTVPSIISSLSEENTNLTDILISRGLVYSGYNNLPSNYVSSKYKSDGGFNFLSNKLIAYSDSIECKPLYYPDDDTARIELITNLQTAYSGTIIETQDGINELVTVNLSDPNAVDLLGSTVINNNLGGKIDIPLSSDNTPTECTWVSKFDNTFWGEQLGEPNRVVWADGNLVFTIDGLSSISDELGTWVEGYRPEKMRITYATSSVQVLLQFGAEDGPFDSLSNFVIDGYQSGDVIDLAFTETEFSDISHITFTKSNGEDPNTNLVVTNIEYCDMSGEGTPDEPAPSGDITCTGITGEVDMGEGGLQSIDLCTSQTELFYEGEAKNVPKYDSINDDLAVYTYVYGSVFNAGNTYRIQGVDASGCEGDCLPENFSGNIFFFDSIGNPVSYNGPVSCEGTCPNKTSPIDFTPTETGVYYMVVNKDFGTLHYRIDIIPDSGECLNLVSYVDCVGEECEINGPYVATRSNGFIEYNFDQSPENICPMGGVCFEGYGPAYLEGYCFYGTPFGYMGAEDGVYWECIGDEGYANDSCFHIYNW